ncbi:hypothetical protein [Salarchaeum sp. JOR-1]|uniref:hypothetical protein n=1 Tax=Salarchaeum sp. JOR-1 TaxID=2599399 RepID=UPI001F0EFDEF|nr:hypothetical protein [Salarchaeum sp. JOR-1]
MPVMFQPSGSEDSLTSSATPVAEELPEFVIVYDTCTVLPGVVVVLPPEPPRFTAAAAGTVATERSMSAAMKTARGFVGVLMPAFKPYIAPGICFVFFHSPGNRQFVVTDEDLGISAISSPYKYEWVD